MKLQREDNGWSCPTDPGELGLGLPRWSVSDVEARVLSELFRNLNILEIGTGLGVATREIAKTAKRVYTVDIDLWVKENVAPELPNNVVFSTSIQGVPHWLDAAFIDGLHTAEQCGIDTLDAKRIVKPGGMIVYHDANMQAVMSVIMGLHPVRIDTGAGMAITWNE